jgi:peptidoglycan/LPS O-acetylase OafA/YrhL
MARGSALVHLDHVDGLRAVAVLGVLLYHSVLHGTDDPKLVAAFDFGGHGVELFFVISGLCLSFPFLRSYRGAGDLHFSGTGFFAKRIARILPPYYVVLAFYGALAFTVPWQQGAIHSQAMTTHLTMPGFLAHLAFGAKENQLLDASFWTLRVEAIWYVLFPLSLFAYVYATRWFWTAVAACPALVLFGAHVPGFGTAVAMLLAMPAFLLGIVAADWLLRGFRPPTWLLFAGVIAAVGAATYEFLNPTSDNSRVRLLWDVAAFAFVTLANSSSVVRWAISSRVAIAVGVASYSIYLVHEPVIAILEYYGVPAPVAFSLAVASGFAFWWVVERPLMSGPVRRRIVVKVQNFLVRLTTWQPDAAPTAATPVPVAERPN